MKKINVTLGLFACLLLSACSEHEFYSNLEYTIGEPELRDDGYFLPLSFSLAGIHSAQWIHRIEHYTDGDKIILKAFKNKPPHSDNDTSMNGINLGFLEEGEYALLYEDPSGERYELSVIKFMALLETGSAVRLAPHSTAVRDALLSRK